MNTRFQDRSRLQSTIARAACAAYVLAHKNSQPILIRMDWSSERAEAEIRRCGAAGYEAAGIVCLMPDGGLVSEPIQGFEAACDAARHRFALELYAEMRKQAS